LLEIVECGSHVCELVNHFQGVITDTDTRSIAVTVTLIRHFERWLMVSSTHLALNEEDFYEKTELKN